MKTTPPKSVEIPAEPRSPRNRVGQKKADRLPPEAALAFEVFTEWFGDADEKAYAGL